MNEIYLGNGSNYTVQSAQTVELRETLTLMNGSTEPYQLDVRIKADFSSIPEQYHEVFLNMMTSRYYGRVSFGDNPFSQCLPPKRRKWWQFWKVRY